MIYVYKTSVKSKNDVQELTENLNNLLKEGIWNFDLDDCDNILRVEIDLNFGNEIVKILKANGFECEELTD